MKKAFTQFSEIAAFAADKNNFLKLPDYCDFAKRYRDFISKKGALQAVIVAENEHKYRFFQYNAGADFRVTRPVNADLFIDAATLEAKLTAFESLLAAFSERDHSAQTRDLLNHSAYTLQQSLGLALDALPPGQANQARKVAGDLFERLVLLVLNEIGVVCNSETLRVPVLEDGKELFKMRYQQDLVVKNGGDIRLLGSVKISSKDRIDKVFIDKFLYNKITETDTPHIAVFLNDVQRKATKKAGEFKVDATFLSGRFRGYAVKLNPLDGVYYCDLRPNMRTDEFLSAQISPFDALLCDDIWKFVSEE